MINKVDKLLEKFLKTLHTYTHKYIMLSLQPKNQLTCNLNSKRVITRFRLRISKIWRVLSSIYEYALKYLNYQVVKNFTLHIINRDIILPSLSHTYSQFLLIKIHLIEFMKQKILFYGHWIWNPTFLLIFKYKYFFFLYDFCWEIIFFFK